MILWDIRHGGPTPISTLVSVLVNGTVDPSYSTTGFAIEHNGDMVVFEGSFIFDQFLGIVGGTITAFHVYSDSLAGNLLDATGYALDAGAFLNGSSASDTALPSLVENPITVNGSAQDDIFEGGPQGDFLFGNAGKDYIDGGNGDDFVRGGDGKDDLVGGLGSDTIDYSDETGSLVISLLESNKFTVTMDGAEEDIIETFENVNGGSGNDQITGNGLVNQLFGASGDDVLSGLDGDDMLDGGLGADSLIGGLGDDTYTVDDLDVVTETAGEGVDTAKAEVSHTLAAEVENLVLLGTAAVDGTGNALSNVVTGNAGNNVLSGLDGGDTLSGGTGEDAIVGGRGLDFLTGGDGSDTFVFDVKLAKTNIDHITDFAIGLDRIGLDAGIFKKVNDSGALKKKFFEDGKADDGNDFVIYNKKTGVLTYDKNGDDNGGAVKFAVLQGSPDDITAANFLVI